MERRWLELVPGRPAPHQDPHLHPAGAALGGVAGGQWYQVHKLTGPNWFIKALQSNKTGKISLAGR